MEDGPYTSQCHADPASCALVDFGSDYTQQRLYVTPAQIGGGRLSEHPREGPTVTAIHDA